jgi:predicted small secreted protein
MWKRNALAIVVLLTAATALSGCVPGAGPAVSPSSSATGSAAPTPTPEVPLAASVAISAEAIAVLDSAGAPIASFDYFQPTAEVVAGLSEHLGAPVDNANPGSIETPTGINHVWDDLVLFDTDTPGAAPENPNHYVFVEGTSAGSVPVATSAGVGSAAGVRVGDSTTSLTVGVELASSGTDPSTGRTMEVYRIGIVPLPPHPAVPTEPRNLGVMVVTHTDTGLVERLVAPSANFGV